MNVLAKTQFHGHEITIVEQSSGISGNKDVAFMIGEDVVCGATLTAKKTGAIAIRPSVVKATVIKPVVSTIVTEPVAAEEAAPAAPATPATEEDDSPAWSEDVAADEEAEEEL